MESGARLPTFYSLSSATLLRVFVGLCFKKQLFGAPAMVQWVKNLTAVARVAVEVWVQSLTQCSGLKDPMLLKLWHGLQLWLRFNSWPENFHMPQVQP